MKTCMRKAFTEYIHIHIYLYMCNVYTHMCLPILISQNIIKNAVFNLNAGKPVPYNGELAVLGIDP